MAVIHSSQCHCLPRKRCCLCLPTGCSLVADCWHGQTGRPHMRFHRKFCCIHRSYAEHSLLCDQHGYQPAVRLRQDLYRCPKRRASPHYEVSFDNRKDFERFVRNMSVLVSVQQMKPISVNELSKMIDKDQSSLNKLIIFFEEIGVIRIEESKVQGRAVKTPKVEYDTIEFRLAA